LKERRLERIHEVKSQGDDRFDFGNNGTERDVQVSTIQYYLSVILRGKWVILGCVSLALVAAIAYTKLTKPVYEASSMVLVSPKGVSPLSQVGGGGDLSSTKITNELGILKSQTLADAVAQAILRNPYIDSDSGRLHPIATVRGSLANKAYVAARARGSVRFEPQRESDLIRIIASSGDPREAAFLANTFAEVYEEQNLNASRVHSRALREFLESRLSEQRRALSLAEDSTKKYMEHAGIASMDASSSEIVSQLSQLEADRNGIEIDLQTLRQRLASYEQELPAQEVTAARALGQANDPYIRMLQEQLARLEVQRDVINAQNDPSVLGQDQYARKLRDIDEQIIGLRKKLQSKSSDLIHSAVPEGPGGSQSDPLGYLKQLKQKMLETKMEIESLVSKRTALDRILRDYERKFEAIPKKSLELAKLQRSRMSAEKLYLLVEGKYNEASISEKSEFGYVSTVDRAVIPLSPSKPDMRFNLLVGLLAGLSLGIGFVFVRETMDIRIRTPEDLKDRGFVSLTEVAPMDREIAKSRTDGNVPQPALKFDEHVRLALNPLSFLGESYRRLRTNLLHAQMNGQLRMILVTSANPYEGKTTTACNLALTFAEAHKRVLLIDADIRRPRVHASFGVTPRPGLTDLLFGKVALEDVTRHNVFENLDIIPSGTTIRHPSRVFGSTGMESLVRQMRDRYDWVFIDAPPILVVNDAATLASLVDGTILVVTSGTTRIVPLERACDFLEGAGGKIIGVVLNRFDAKKVLGGYYGSYRYGHYDGSYGYYSSNKKQTLPERVRHWVSDKMPWKSA
jgi:capsular exopolysaccharide synthesis family protein